MSQQIISKIQNFGQLEKEFLYKNFWKREYAYKLVPNFFDRKMVPICLSRGYSRWAVEKCHNIETEVDWHSTKSPKKIPKGFLLKVICPKINPAPINRTELTLPSNLINALFFSHGTPNYLLYSKGKWWDFLDSVGLKSAWAWKDFI